MRFALLFMLAATVSYGQQFKKLKVGFGFGKGLDWPSEYVQKPNASIAYFEPSYRINDRIAVGLRWENGTTASIFPTIGGGGSSIGSFGFNGQYYLSNKNFRPFAGLGVGFYRPRLNGSFPYGKGSVDEETRFGFYPRVGFDFGHFSFTVDYNIVPSSKAMINDYPSNSYGYGQLGNSYGSVKLGVFIGGGRK